MDLRASNLTRHSLVAKALGGDTVPKDTETEAVVIKRRRKWLLILAVIIELRILRAAR